MEEIKDNDIQESNWLNIEYFTLDDQAEVLNKKGFGGKMSLEQTKNKLHVARTIVKIAHKTLEETANFVFFDVENNFDSTNIDWQAIENLNFSQQSAILNESQFGGRMNLDETKRNLEISRTIMRMTHKTLEECASFIFGIKLTYSINIKKEETIENLREQTKLNVRATLGRDKGRNKEAAVKKIKEKTIKIKKPTVKKIKEQPKISINLKGGKYCFSSENGERLTDYIYDYAGEFVNKHAKIGKNIGGYIYYGFINTKFTEVIKAKYNEVIDFSEGMAAVRKGSKWGFVNEKGSEAVKIYYDEVENFSGGRARVKIKHDSFFIDKTGFAIKE